MAVGYDYDLWPLVYDQYYGDLHALEHPFYADALKGCRGPLLEVGCGVGTMMFKLLAQGLDVHGFDVAPKMLDELLRRGEQQQIPGLAERITCQDMTSFSYDRQFEAVVIPARAFLHVTTQEGQIAALRRCCEHLEPGGRLITNFFVPELEWYSQLTKKSGFDFFDCYRLPESGELVEVGIERRVHDLSSQLLHVRWLFAVGNRTTETEMPLRWIFRSEFELLLRLAGFSRWELFGDFDRTPFDDTQSEMVWIAHK